MSPLESLFGSKNIQKILLFLFVNGKCYGTLLQRSLKTALTPLQKALNKLEKGGVIVSHFEGKTRLYRFNPAYPLLEELQLLIKKGYTLLPAEEKRSYFSFKTESSHLPLAREEAMEQLRAFWEKLEGISRLTFSAKTQSKEEIGWNGSAKGEVAVVREGRDTLIFHEKGSWLGKEGSALAFSNCFRWSFDRKAAMISLEHLRRGPDHPVFLFHLIPSGKRVLSSLDSYLCQGDSYFGSLRFDSYSLRFSWRVIGPKKNEEIDYYYS